MAQQRLGNIAWGDLTFGPGTPYAVSVLAGLDDLPDVRADDMAREGQHGDYTGPDYTGARTITLGLTMVADDPDAFRQLCLDLRAATQPQKAPAALQFLQQDTLVWAKVRRRAIPYDAENLWRSGTAALELYCADPYLYGLEEWSASTTAYSPSSGRTYPLVYAGVPELTNSVLNPSAELDAANVAAYSSAGTAPTVAQNTPGFGARYGVDTLLTTWTASGTGGAKYTLGTSYAAGVAVRASAWVYLPSVSGISAVNLMFFNGTTLLQSVSVTTPAAATWTRIDGGYTVASGQAVTHIGVRLTTTGATTMHLDGVMATPAATTQPYVDGDQMGCIWDGTPHASTSRRVAGTNRQYGTPGTSGQITATNAGASPAYPTLRIDGPVANPSVEQPNTGAQIVIDATLGDGEFLLVDTRSRAVLLNGSTPRRSWVRGGSTWPLLMPGSNDLVYRGSALPGLPGVPSLLTVTWRDTSL
ncbi:phage distal tail protein [Streptomyces sp. MI02-7b]|uniref:phage distal tail protein n=1 Tax=Streptomyces sp. MI02-7b TaxID=462941 RepID=UPI0029B4F227|nr:phage tail domain-containing protein [Streptomyces sp. MI02-7b]MDX3074626.1 phage tail family protein [Streptomyces sp. MI02-7b]